MREISLRTERRTQLLDITEQVEQALNGANGAAAALVYVPHTTAGVTINEDIDPVLASDLEQALNGTNGAAAALVYVPHTTAGVTINEDIDPVLAKDLEQAMEKVVEDGWTWRHDDADGPNAPSHMRASLISPEVLVPLQAKRQSSRSRGSPSADAPSHCAFSSVIRSAWRS